MKIITTIIICIILLWIRSKVLAKIDKDEAVALAESRQSAIISGEGGIRKKYSVLIDHILSSHEHCRIFQETNTMLSVGARGAAGSQIYYIYPSYGNVIIKMEVKNNPLICDTKMEWNFPEGMNQEDMLSNINKDIANKFNSILSCN